LACHLTQGGTGVENPVNNHVFALVSRRHVRVTPAGNPFAVHGGRCVGVFGPAGLVVDRFSSLASSATFIGGAAVCPVRSIAMNTSDFRSLHAQYDPDNAEPDRERSIDPNAFVATLHHIGTGAAADGQPWPERHQLPGRCLQLADADCALAGLRVVAELMLAAERTRQNGAPEEYLGDRVMEGLKMACVALTAQVAERLHVRE